MLLYPKLYIKDVTKIDSNILKQNNIRGLILDVDNTLIDYNEKMIDGLEKWSNNLKENKIKLCILSNSNKKEKVENVAKTLDIPYIFFAKKPLKSGFKKVQKMLEIENEHIRSCRRSNNDRCSRSQ